MNHQQAIEKTQEAWHAWGKIYQAWLNAEATYQELEQGRTSYLEARAAHALHHDMTEPGAEYRLRHHFCEHPVSGA